MRNAREKRSKKYQEQICRFAVPPYFFGKASPISDVEIWSLPGNMWKPIEERLAPTALECRIMLIDLRKDLRWSRDMLAAYLGVSRATVRSWESGARNPDGPAKRLIWLLTQAFKNPKVVSSVLDIIAWGKKELVADLGRAYGAFR